MNDSFIEVASKWIENECACIVPCHDKVPIIKGWNHGNALSTVESVRDFFNKPNGANGIGVLMGDGIICIDVDMHQGMGMKSIEIWQKEHGKFPNTYFETTPNGGKHLYFYVDKIYNTRLHILEDVDIIANGHQSIIYPTKDYTKGNNLPIARANDSVIKLLNLKNHHINEYDLKTGAQYKSVPFNKDDSILDGQRHDFLIREISKLKNKGVQDSVIETYIREVNERLCVPPIPKKELETTVIGAIERMDGMSVDDTRQTKRPTGAFFPFKWRKSLETFAKRGLLADFVFMYYDYVEFGIVPKDADPIIEPFMQLAMEFVDDKNQQITKANQAKALARANGHRKDKGLPPYKDYEEYEADKERNK